MHRSLVSWVISGIIRSRQNLARVLQINRFPAPLTAGVVSVPNILYLHKGSNITIIIMTT